MIGLGVPSTVVALGAVLLIAAIMWWARRESPSRERSPVARTDQHAVTRFGIGLAEAAVILLAVVGVVILLSRT